jgi:hypothetical protein
MIELTQAEADALRAMEKLCEETATYLFPLAGKRLSIPLVSRDRRETFLLDVYRGRIDLSKVTYQNRARQVVGLVRLDLGGKPHSNPGESSIITGPHLHLYREGFGLRWAFPVPELDFSDLTNVLQVLDDFLRFCRVTKKPIVQGVC